VITSDRIKDESAEPDERPKLADQEWDHTAEVLKLLARDVKVVNIAAQADRSEKWVRDLRKKSASYSASLIATFPLEVRDYLMLLRHRRDLAKAASEICGMWRKYVEAGAGIERGLIVSDAASESFALKHGHVVVELLTHLKTESPTEFENFAEWRDLISEPYLEDWFRCVKRVARGVKFNGTCETCRDWA